MGLSTGCASPKLRDGFILTVLDSLVAVGVKNLLYSISDCRSILLGTFLPSLSVTEYPTFPFLTTDLTTTPLGN